MNRRQFVAAAATTIAAPALTRAAPATRPPATQTTQPIPPDLVWHDVREWGVEGRGFDDTESFFDRLPARAKNIVRKPVWDLSLHTSGMSVHFQADAPALYVRYTLRGKSLAMPHMPAT